MEDFAGSMIATVRDSLASAKRADRGRGHDADRPDLQRAVADPEHAPGEEDDVGHDRLVHERVHERGHVRLRGEASEVPNSR